MIDALDTLKDSYQGNIIDLENILFNLNDAVQNIPMSKKKKESNKKIEIEDEGDEEDEPIDEEIREKILRFDRDFIISKNMTVREAFDIES